jgi:DNA-directed RNA polymerase alpha subunit
MFENIQEKKNVLSCDINDVDVCIVNALRRIIMSEIPTIAFDEEDIVIHKNSCSLHDQFLSHRISLIPLHFTKKEIEEFEPDKYKFVLKAKNTTNDTMSITTKHFDILLKSKLGKLPEATKERILPANPFTKDHVLITKLKPNVINPEFSDELYIEANAKIGIGKQHARWSPVSICSFYYNIDEAKEAEGLSQYLEKHDDIVDKSELRERFNTLEKYRYYRTNRFNSN